MNNESPHAQPAMQNLLHRYRDKITTIGARHENLHHLRHLLSHTGPATRQYAVEGVWAHRKLLAVGRTAEALYFAPELIYSAEALALLEAILAQVPQAYLVSAKTFSKLSERDKPDGFLSTGALSILDPVDLSLPKQAVVVVLDGLETPGNAGTILRSCDGAGVDAVLFCRTRTRLTHPKLIKASMGAVFTLPLVEFDSPADCAQWLRERKFTIYLADVPEDEESAQENAMSPYRHMEGNAALVVGNERYGLRDAWHQEGVHTVAIPMRGFGDSLNVGVAASILAYDLCNKKREFPSKPASGK